MRPDVRALTETGATFADGTAQTYTVIFYCTGYKYTFPFLSIDCGISVEDNYVQPLYKHIINISYPTMALIGLPFYVCASQMFDLQVRFVMKFLSGQKPWPTKDEMLKDTELEMAKRWARGYKKRQAHMMGTDQVTAIQLDAISIIQYILVFSNVLRILTMMICRSRLALRI